MLNKNNIKIALQDISSQNRAVLEFYFNNAGKDLYSVVHQSEADAIIIDYDHPGAKENVKQITTESRTPIILFSIKEQNVPSTLWLAKPLSADALGAAANTINEMIVEAEEAKNEIEEVEVETETDTSNNEVIEELNLTEETLEEEQTTETEIELFDFSDTSESEEVQLPKSAEAKENSILEAGLAATAGVGAVVATTLDFDDDEIEIKDTNTEDEIVEDIANEENVDALLDSLMSDDELENDLSEDELEAVETALENDAEDSLFDNLLTDEDVEETDSSINDSTEDLQTKDAFDVLKSVDNELEGNFDLQNTLDSETSEAEEVSSDLGAFEILNETTESAEEKNTEIEVTENSLIDESFTLHHDIDSSDEDVFADTLKVNYADAKKEQAKTEDQFEELTLEVNESLAESNIEEGLEETIATEDALLDFDFKANDNEEDELSLSANSELDDLLKEVSGETDNSTIIDESTEETTPEIAEFINTGGTLEDLIEDESDDFAADNFATDNSDTDNLEDDDLQSLLNEVRQEADKSTSDDFTSPSSSGSAHEQTKAERRWMQLCGNVEALKGQKEVAKNSFDPKKYLLAVVLDQIKTTKAKEEKFRLKFKDLIIVIDHTKNKIYCNTPLTDDEYPILCSNEIDPKDVKIHDLDYSEERLYQSKMEKNSDRTHSFESFIWTTSMLTARGRLPVNTNITKPVGLKTWPNLTRVELIPHAMNMAAVFSKHPGSLLDVTKWLKIEQKYVFAFYNAALSLDMIEFDAKKLKQVKSSFGKKGSEKSSEERGFFGRLLKRLKT